jgi:hypothetical protein
MQLILLVQERPNPSTDYYVLPALRRAGGEIRCCGFRELPRACDLTGATVVLVRYIPPAWRRLIESERSRIGRLVFFMDDDLLDTSASQGLPWRYRWKLARLAAWHRGWLHRQEATLWVSTDYLARKYRNWNPRLVPPSPLAGPATGSAAEGECRVFYHGTASHGAEVRWLMPVIGDVLARDERLSFEIVGGGDVDRLYRGIPRVNTVRPMKWPAYQAFLDNGVRHIGLAPQLDHPFNRARSHTKFFDITRCGAAGVYAAGGACAEAVRDGEDGLVLAMEAELWVNAILRLAGDEPLRLRMRHNAQQRAQELARLAREAYEGLL